MKLESNKEIRGDIIFKAIVGSHAHGTNIPESDIDIKGVYLQSPENVLIRGYQQQVEITADETYYELRRFIDLCCTGNPTMLELAFSPEDCIEYKHPVFDMLLEHKEMFLTKACKWSFGGYAKSQISKASGLEKKMNWDESEMVRKTPLDFCFILDGYDSYSLVEHLKTIPGTSAAFAKNKNGKGMYALFTDPGDYYNFRDLIGDDSNSLRHQKIPKEWFDVYPNIKPLIVWYDQDSYSRHCRKFKEYEKWKEERNTQRYVDIENHGQQIDGKNMLHCTRLIEMGKEIAEGKGFNVRRPNAEYLISIRKGKVDLQTLLDNAGTMMDEMDSIYEKSNLPDKCDRGFFQSLLVKIRQRYYGLRNSKNYKSNS